MENNGINAHLLDTFFAEDLESFSDGLKKYFLSLNITNFTLWKVTGNICEPVFSVNANLTGTFDIFELGFNGEVLYKFEKEVRFFDQIFFISYSMFLGYRERIVFAATFHEEPDSFALSQLNLYGNYIGKSALNISSSAKQMDIYVDYQKKVDFVKKASVIFKALNIEEVISISLNFFMDAFSSDAVCAIYKGAVSSIGLNEEDINSSIFIKNIPLKEYIDRSKKTEFIENTIFSEKFNIRNIFLVYEENAEISFVLFNIITDVVPDKDFSSLVSAIVSIAIENAANNESMIKFKLEETEIAATVEILNKFVQRDITVPSVFDINAVTFPARNAGGDFIYLEKTGNKIAFCLADVCGKGYSAAVFTVVLSVFMESFGQIRPISATLEELNKFLLEKNFDNRFITLFAGIADEEKCTLEYISCGHDPAVIISNNNIQILKSAYLPLGLMKETYRVSKTDIPHNSIFFVYTDGLIEYMNFDSLVKLVGSFSDKTAAEINNCLYSQLVSDRDLQKDDFTCILLKNKTKSR